MHPGGPPRVLLWVHAPRGGTAFPGGTTSVDGLATHEQLPLQGRLMSHRLGAVQILSLADESVKLTPFPRSDRGPSSSAYQEQLECSMFGSEIWLGLSYIALLPRRHPMIGLLPCVQVKLSSDK
jgi:hypothetical protein